MRRECARGIENAERGEVVNAFGIGSRPLWLMMGVFACGYFAVTLYADSAITGWWQWIGLFAGFVLFVVAGMTILDSPGDPLPGSTTSVIAAMTVSAVAVTLFSLPSPPSHVMQTGPPMGASVIILAFVAVRGRPLAAWLASGCISVIAGVWGAVSTAGAVWGLSITLPGYAIMIMGSLFSVMLRPMARNIYELREANERQAALDAAAAAATEVRDRRLAALDERARPVLTRMARRETFTADEVATARLLEAQLRDGIRASGLDLPMVRDAAWRARQRGVRVVLLDDGGLATLNDAHATMARAQLAVAVEDVLDGTDGGRVTVRIQPPGRDALATVGVDAGDTVSLIAFGVDPLAGDPETEASTTATRAT
ncbi:MULTISPECIES: hypothetical protein [unclassified Gordonia (in: high G+C Gram-positive bacteria)]|uniref:hypothetical protein n=1 Tax=unclassified Gordonia (in: high G+C Gram-positive bacteria) TaxID=2657482 RepID=UPI0027DE252C|nr:MULTISPECIES: hypothetical protein [unclassified Gordonia (in: high G+C Gram-positive bacteria)]